MTQNILVVEDDEYKGHDICTELSNYGQFEVILKKSVADAVKVIHEMDFDIVVLDMSLPTYEKIGLSSSGPSQPQGGVEVLRYLQHLKKTSVIIIVSQFKSIEMNGRFIDLRGSASLLSKRYGLTVLGAIFYDFESDKWKKPFMKYLGAYEAANNRG